MKRLLCTMLALVVGVGAMMAVPAKRGVTKTLTLKDGTRVEATLVGDEHVHYYQTADRRAVQKVDGAFQFVNRDSLVRLFDQRVAERNKARAARMMAKPRKVSYSGKKQGLVIMVEFSDVEFTYDRDTFNDYFNKVGFNQDGMRGSVHDYFLEQSYGKFDLEFDVVGPVTLTQTASYYSSDNKRVAKMVNDVCKQLDSEVDYSKYDWDDDGYVDQVYVIYAGYGEAQGAENTIWPHEWSVYGGVNNPYRTAEGPRLDTYGISCELMGDGINDTGRLDGIGTSCHEFSHCLGLPDFYDTAHNDGSEGNFGMAVWDLMDSGCYNGSNNGRSPSGYTAYERWVSGWLEPEVLDCGRSITSMPAIEEEPVAYVIYNDAKKNEYYLLANHQKKGFDQSAYGHGMLVIHVDYDQMAWQSNTINNETDHQRMTIIPADNATTYTAASFAADPFPGTRRKTQLTNTSTPKASLYNANTDGQKLMNKPITSITEKNGLISFEFMGGSALEAPKVKGATNITSTGFTANWEPVEDADSYTVCLSTTVDDGKEENDSVILAEDFGGFEGLTSSLTTDISSRLDDYTLEPGWTGKNLYAHNKFLRVGKKGAAGELRTPLIEDPEKKALTILLTPSNAATSGTTSLQLRLELSTGGYMTADITNISVPSEGLSSYLLKVDSWGYGDFYVGIYPTSMDSGIYIHSLTILDGAYSWGDLGYAPQMAPSNVKVLDVNWQPVNCPPVVKTLPRKAPKTTETQFTTKETHYIFTDLDPTATYSYKVRATTTSGANSTWSDEMPVDLTTFISPVPVELSPANGQVYMLDGRQAAGRVLRPGLYIRDGKKFLVK